MSKWKVLYMPLLMIMSSHLTIMIILQKKIWVVNSDGNFPTGDPVGLFICAASPNRYHAVTGICMVRSAHDIVNGGRHPVWQESCKTGDVTLSDSGGLCSPRWPLVPRRPAGPDIGVLTDAEFKQILCSASNLPYKWLIWKVWFVLPTYQTLSKRPFSLIGVRGGPMLSSFLLDMM
jgi:hypothetical protein